MVNADHIGYRSPASMNAVRWPLTMIWLGISRQQPKGSWWLLLTGWIYCNTIVATQHWGDRTEQVVYGLVSDKKNNLILLFVTVWSFYCCSFLLPPFQETLNGGQVDLDVDTWGGFTCHSKRPLQFWPTGGESRAFNLCGVFIRSNTEEKKKRWRGDAYLECAQCK